MPERDEQFATFIAEVSRRIDAGAEAYGDRSFSADPGLLVRELEQEALDLAGWGFVLWVRLRALRGAAARLTAKEHLAAKLDAIREWHEATDHLVERLPLVGAERERAIAVMGGRCE